MAKAFAFADRIEGSSNGQCIITIVASYTPEGAETFSEFSTSLYKQVLMSSSQEDFNQAMLDEVIRSADDDLGITMVNSDILYQPIVRGVNP